MHLFQSSGLGFHLLYPVTGGGHVLRLILQLAFQACNVAVQLLLSSQAIAFHWQGAQIPNKLCPLLQQKQSS